jgi:hypothetical protein
LFFTSGFRERASGELVADVRHADPYHPEADFWSNSAKNLAVFPEKVDSESNRTVFGQISAKNRKSWGEPKSAGRCGPVSAAAHVLAAAVSPQGNQESQARQTRALTPYRKDAHPFVLQRVGLNNFVALLCVAVAVLAKMGDDLIND